MGRNHFSDQDDSKRSKGFAAGGAKMGPSAQPCARTLTAAEKKILALVSLAKTNKEIAVKSGISPATVKRHLENILRKLSLKNRVEAAIFGLMINQCPHRLDSGCALALWRRERDSELAPWAD